LSQDNLPSAPIKWIVVTFCALVLHRQQQQIKTNIDQVSIPKHNNLWFFREEVQRIKSSPVLAKESKVPARAGSNLERSFDLHVSKLVIQIHNRLRPQEGKVSLQGAALMYKIHRQ
jgi:hypothetical protein